MIQHLYFIFCSRKQGLKYTGSVTNANNRLIEKEPDFSTLGSKIKLLLKQVRIHQWAKNALIFCPALAVHSILTSEQYGNLVLAFSSFCFLTSSVYIINDLFDIWNDRAHQKKKNRPLASGNMSIPAGIIIAVCCLSLSSIFALCLSLKFFAFTTLYFAINILYSFKLKNIMALDCVLLSGMYTYRIFLGCVAASLSNSLWLFSFAIFLFLSLAFIKRYIELFNLKKQGKEQIIGRPYTVADSSVVETLYIVFGSLSILVFALYLSSTDIQHTFSSIWFAYASLLVILYWMIYMFIKASRGLIHEDPVVFVLTDRLSLYSLLKACKKIWLDEDTVREDHRFHHVSTDEVYGTLKPNAPPFAETNQYLPNSPYSASKASSDLLARAFHHTYGLKVTTSNCSNNYGYYHHSEKLIPLTLTNILRGKNIPVYGDGKQLRDWLFVTAHCNGIDLVLKKGRLGESYNIGGINEWASIDIVNLLCEQIDQLFAGNKDYCRQYPDCPCSKGQSAKTLITHVTDRLGHDRRYAIDAHKIMSELGYKPRDSFEPGIAKTVRWYLDYTEWWKKLVK